MKQKKPHKRKRGSISFLSAILVICISVQCFGETTGKNQPVSQKAEQNVGEAIHVHQKIQKTKTKWEQEKSALVIEYEQLLAKKQALEQENQTLSARRSHLQNLIQTLDLQKKESERIANELLPFLSTVYRQLEALVANDTPFLKEERSARLSTLSKTIKDPEVSIAEKYRKVMEALFIEAEYGSTIEVYQEKILIASHDGEQMLGNIFRLGRVSLFFLSLDKNSCGVFNPSKNQWDRLPDEMLPAIRSAVEIGSKRRPVELLPLPIGQLAGQGEES